jgi:hypothetical protein
VRNQVEIQVRFQVASQVENHQIRDNHQTI